MKPVFDIIRFCRDFHVPYDDDGPEVSPGWVNVQCPFCHDTVTEQHLGFNLSSGAVKCWRCGKHGTLAFIARISKGSSTDVSRIAKQYTSEKTYAKRTVSKAQNAGFVTVPRESGPLCDAARRYLEKRHFDPDLLVDKWGLLSTRHLGDYKFRIIVPIYLNYQLVSYQGRDYTDRQKLRYKACRLDKEVIHHKHLLYGSDHTMRRCLLVEGVTDVWRMGYGCAGTFGTAYTKEQIGFLQQHYDEVFILFDSSDPKAERTMNELAEQLALVIDTVEVIKTDWDDPGSAPQDEADALMKELRLPDIDYFEV